MPGAEGDDGDDREGLDAAGTAPPPGSTPAATPVADTGEPAPPLGEPGPETDREPGPRESDGSGRRLALATVFFSLATGLSRVAGLIREIVAATFFGVSGAMSAFTIAFNVPNLVRALFADAALQGAFVPVFTELLERGERKEAFRVASSLLFLILLGLGGLTALFFLFAEPIMGLFTPGFDPELEALTVSLSRLMFPIVLLLALSGLVVGMLNSFEHFNVPALTPLAWNLVIIGALVGLTPLLDGDDRIYAYAIGVLAGTVVQLVLPIPWLRGRDARFTVALDWRNPHVRQVLKLMLPVTIALGLINFNALINATLGTLVQVEAPAAIEKAFRIYMLPQGLFSVAVATILFPRLSRLAARGAQDELRATMANGIRQICLLLIPSAALLAVLAEPITRLVYERGEFDAAATDLVAQAMVVWAASLPFQGASLLFSRTFFSLQRPWATTALAGVNLVVNAAVSIALYKPLGVGGIVLGTVVGTVVMTVGQALLLRGPLRGVEGPAILAAVARMLVAALALSAVSLLVWRVLDEALGRAFVAQVASLGVGIGAGLAAYAGLVFLLRVPEARQVISLVRRRGR